MKTNTNTTKKNQKSKINSLYSYHYKMCLYVQRVSWGR